MRSDVVRRQVRAWVFRAAVAVVLALVVNTALTRLSVDHDSALVALLALASVAAVVLVLTALDAEVPAGWRVHRSDARPGSGEDTRTAMYRHVIEAHLTSRDADDAILWQVADLARLRLRQLHGLRYDDDPVRATELLGPVLADWVSHDRRHRYVPGAPHQRFTVAELGDAVRRIEEL